MVRRVPPWAQGQWVAKSAAVEWGRARPMGGRVEGKMMPTACWAQSADGMPRLQEAVWQLFPERWASQRPEWRQLAVALAEGGGERAVAVARLWPVSAAKQVEWKEPPALWERKLWVLPARQQLVGRQAVLAAARRPPPLSKPQKERLAPPPSLSSAPRGSVGPAEQFAPNRRLHSAPQRSRRGSNCPPRGVECRDRNESARFWPQSVGLQ